MFKKKDLRKLVKSTSGKATFNPDAIAKNPNKGRVIASEEPVSTDMEKLGYSSTIVSKAPQTSKPSAALKREAKKESIVMLDQETSEDQKATIIADKTGKTVEQVREEVKDKPTGLSDSFKRALSGIAPSAIGMLVGGLIAGNEGAVAGFEKGNAIGAQMQGQANKDREASFRDRQQDAVEYNQRRDDETAKSQFKASQNESNLNLDLRAKGRGDSPVSFNSNTGKYMVGSEEVPATDIQNTKFMEASLKSQTDLIKSKADMGEKDRKFLVDAKKFSDGRMKEVRVNEAATSASRMVELSNMQPDALGDIKVRSLNKGKEGSILQFKNPTAARDAALIINFMKLADPGSVVREGEFRMAASLGPLGESLKAAWLKRSEGPLLTGEIRTQLVEAGLAQAEGIYNTAKIIDDDTINTFKDTGIDTNRLRHPGMVILESALNIREKKAAQQSNDYRKTSKSKLGL